MPGVQERDWSARRGTQISWTSCSGRPCRTCLRTELSGDLTAGVCVLASAGTASPVWVPRWATEWKGNELGTWASLQSGGGLVGGDSIGDSGSWRGDASLVRASVSISPRSVSASKRSLSLGGPSTKSGVDGEATSKTVDGRRAARAMSTFSPRSLTVM